MKISQRLLFLKTGFSHTLAAVLSLVILFACFQPAVAQVPKMRLKLATIAPTGSCYHESLLRMAEAWKEASNGAISMTIYADGKLGGEADNVGLLEIGSIHAAMLTGTGLMSIEPDVTALQSVPMLFHSQEELDHLMITLQPKLEAKLEDKGYVTLIWGDAGFVRFFSKVPVNELSDMRNLKVFAWAGSTNQVEVYQKAGYKTIPLETADIVSGLQTGLIDATPAPPIFALATQIDRSAPYMLDINWSPIVGALVIRKSVWDKIPPQLQAEFRKAANVAGDEIRKNSRQEAIDAVLAMEKRGLKITRLAPDKYEEWVRVVEASYPLIRGAVVPEDIFDQSLEVIKAWREQQK